MFIDVSFFICVFVCTKKEKGKYGLVCEMNGLIYLGKGKSFNWFSIYIMMEKGKEREGH